MPSLRHCQAVVLCSVLLVLPVTLVLATGCAPEAPASEEEVSASRGALASQGALAPQGAPPATAGATAPAYNIVVDGDVRIPVRDGVELGATLLRPDAPGTFPTLVYRTPYGKDAYAGYSEFPWKAARRGFLVFLVDVRGRYTSEGTFRAYHQEKQDGHDTIEWAGDHERSDGRVGSWGGSYPGFVQWLALSRDPSHYATAVPDMTPTGSHQLFYVGGAFGLAYMDWFHGSILADLRRRAGDRSGPWDDEASWEEWLEVRKRWYLHRPLVDVPHMKDHAPYFYDWLTHPDKTGWWDFADVEDDFDRMRVPVLLVSGWYDSTYGPVGAMRGFNGMREHAATPEAREETRLVLGPWTHTSLDVFTTESFGRELGPNAGIDFDEVLLRWFERWVAGIDNGVDEEPPVRLFVMGENRWRAEETFPPERARPTPLYLHGSGPGDPGPEGPTTAATVGPRDGSAGGSAGGLSFEAPGSEQSATNYVYDPRDPIWVPDYPSPESLEKVVSEERDDVLIFDSEPLEEDLEVTGEIVARLFVSSDARDTDFSVTVCDVAPDGTTYSVTGPEAGYLRMRYREGLDHQVLMEPGEVYEVEIGSLITSNLFKRGHRIRVIVTSSRLPHFDANPNTGGEIATETRLVTARQTLHHDRSRPSSIILPVIPGSR